MRYVLNLFVITCTCGFTEINEAKRSVPVLGWLTGRLAGERADSTAWLCILGSDLRQGTDWKQQHKGRWGGRERAFWWLQQLH